jgi:predicted permease
MLREFRFAIRSLRRRPGFAAAVVLTLALGIGTSTAVFSLLDASLIKPLPFDDPGRLTMLWGVYGKERDIRGASPREIADWRELNQSLSDVSVFDDISLTVRTNGEPRNVEAEMVSESYFRILGAAAARGRTFAPDEDRVPDARPVAVLSHAIWTTQFASDPAIVGKQITINDRPFTVVGVMTPAFRGLSFDTDIWVPMAMISLTGSPALLETRANRWLGAVGRLRDGVSLEAAQRDLDRVAARLTAAYPESHTDRGVQLLSVQDAALGTTRDLLLSLFAAVMLFLAVACANVINLQLVRATSRRREIALRVAVGADRIQLFRQLLAEGLTISAAGAIAGVTVAAWALGGLVGLLPDGVLPEYVVPSIDWRVLGFAAVLTILCGVVFGLVPALQTRRVEVAESLKVGARSAAGGITSVRKLGAQQILIISEVAIALVLLIGGALMVQSLRSQLAVSPGFQPEGVVTAQLSLPRGRYEPAARAQLVDRLLERLDAVPQIQSAAVGWDLPLTGGSNGATLFIDGVTPTPIRYFRHSVTPDYFTTLGIPLLRGRAITAADRDSAPLVVVISDAMARRFWPGRDPVGQRFRTGTETGPEVTVVGVVGTARFRDLTTSLATTEPDVFFSFAQRTDTDLSIAIRTDESPAAAAAAIQRALAGVDPGLPVYQVTSMTELLEGQTATARFGSALLGAFSIVALLLASIGIYGVLAFVIGLSRREIAIRMALGATTARVVGLIVRQGMGLVMIGLAIGAIGAFFVTPALSTQLFGVTANDPATFLIVPMLLAIVALVATYLPSRGAARVDPQQALKSD